MDKTDEAEFIIEVSKANSTDEELDRLTRQLLSELRGTDVEIGEVG